MMIFADMTDRGGPDILSEHSTQGLLQNFSQPGVRWFFGKMFDKDGTGEFA